MAATRKKNGTFKNPWNKGLTKETSPSLKIVSQKTSGKNNGMYGKHLTDEQKAKCVHYGSSNGRYGKPVSEDTRKKISNANKGKPSKTKGRCWYTNGEKNIRLFPDSEVPQGYYSGLTKSHPRRKKDDRAEIVYT